MFEQCSSMQVTDETSHIHKQWIPCYYLFPLLHGLSMRLPWKKCHACSRHVTCILTATLDVRSLHVTCTFMHANMRLHSCMLHACSMNVTWTCMCPTWFWDVFRQVSCMNMHNSCYVHVTCMACMFDLLHKTCIVHACYMHSACMLHA